MPSMINEMAFAEVRRILAAYPGVLLIDAGKLKSGESLALRRQLCDLGASMRIVKMRIVRRAVSEDLAAHLTGSGSVALVGSADLASVAKLLNGMVKEEKIALRAGLIEGRALDAAGAARLADLPTKAQAQALVARALRAPVRKLGRLLKAPASRLGRALKKYVENQGASMQP